MNDLFRQQNILLHVRDSTYNIQCRSLPTLLVLPALSRGISLLQNPKGKKWTNWVLALKTEGSTEARAYTDLRCKLNLSNKQPKKQPRNHQKIQNTAAGWEWKQRWHHTIQFLKIPLNLDQKKTFTKSPKMLYCNAPTQPQKNTVWHNKEAQCLP